MRLISLLFALLLSSAMAHGQCPTVSIPGSLTPGNGDTLSGTYDVGLDFILNAGDTIYVRPFALGGCGELVINASGNINVGGVIIGDGSGFPGGVGGAAGTANNVFLIEACPAPTDQCADVFPFGGVPGGNGTQFPGGGGSAGSNGNDGSGRRNICGTFGDEWGRVGAAGGAGGGAGGSYGGVASLGGGGGGGTLPTLNASSSTTNSCTGAPFVAGGGGVGGASGTNYGTPTGTDIDKGSGGAGAGGGGRGRFPGTDGGNGGTGGARIVLDASGNLTFTGVISANGQNGRNGGDGGNAGESQRCCTDLCAGIDEYNHTGAGGGGGGAGGGSGGGILLRVGGIANISGLLQAEGGNGGNGGAGGQGYSLSLTESFICNPFNPATTTASATNASNGFQGGGGSGGRVKVFYNDCAPGNAVGPTVQVTGGSGAFGNAGPGSSHISTDGSILAGFASPALQTLCYNGDPGTLVNQPAVGGYGGISYFWQIQPDCQGPWNYIPGANSLTYDPPPGQTDTACYRLLISSGNCLIYSDTFTVNIQPRLVAPLVPNGTVTGCQGDTIPLITTGGTGASYQWYFNGQLLVGATDSVFDARNNGAYTVVINYPSGCPGESAPTTLNLSAPPPAFVTAPSPNLCPGDSVTLTATGGGTYQWLFNGASVAGATNPTLTANTAGAYEVVVTSAAGCRDTSAAFNLSTAAAPIAQIQAQGDTVFCTGDSVNLLAGGGNFFAWFLNGAPIPGAASNNIWVNQSGNYSVMVTSLAGCRDSSRTLQVQALPQPQAQIAAAGPINLCEGDSVLFLASGGPPYQWLFNNQPSPGDTNNFIIAAQQGDYSVVIDGPGGCIDTSQTFAVTWYPPVTSGISANGAPFVCPGDTLTLTGYGGLSYQWVFNGSPVPGANGRFFAATQPGTYEVIATDQWGCSSSDTLVTIFPGQDPNASVSMNGNNPLCPGDTTFLIAQGGISYQWLRDGVELADDTLAFLEIATTGNYSVIAYTSCGQDTSTPVLIQAFPGPIAGFMYNNLPRLEVEFIDSSISGALWTWDFGLGGPLSNDQNPRYTFPAPGTYPITVIVEDIFGCRDTLSKDIVVKDPEFFIPNVFSPNGDDNNDVAWTNWGNHTDVDFRIYDRWGSLVFQTSEENVWWDGIFQGKPSPEGVYFYQFNALDMEGQEVRASGNISLFR